MQYSYKVLSDYGNMSSPTILFVLNEIMQAEHAEGETIFSIKFHLEIALYCTGHPLRLRIAVTTTVITQTGSTRASSSRTAARTAATATATAST